MWGLWGLMAIIAGIIGAVSAESRDALRNVTIVSWVACELFVMCVIWGAKFGWWCNFLKIHRNGWLFGGAVLAFIAAFACWIPSGGGGESVRVWCNADSALQGHGFWHIFAAVGTFMIYLHWSEERILC